MEGSSEGTKNPNLIEAFDSRFQDEITTVSAIRKKIVNNCQQLAQAFANGDLRGFERARLGLEESNQTLQSALTRLAAGSAAFRGEPYSLESYVQAFEAACRGVQLPLEGHFPSYEIFPLTLRFNLEEGFVTVDKKRVYSLRPNVLVAQIARMRERLLNAPFNAARFRQALLYVYHILQRQGNGSNQVSLREIHKLLALREGTGTEGYPVSQFAFDIYRLRRTDDNLVEGNKRLVFVPGRSARQAIVVPLGNGRSENLVALQVQEVA